MKTNRKVSEAELKEHFLKVMARRGANVEFERFEQVGVVNEGNRLHMDVIDSGGDATLVFIPGTAVYGLTFGNFLAAMADEGFNIVSVDPRGHGRSEGTPGDYTIPGLVSDAAAAVKYARERFAKPIVVSGSSQGGIAAFYTAAALDDLAGVICHNVADLADPDNARLTDRPLVARILKPILLTLASLFPMAGIRIAKYYDLLSKGHEHIKKRLEEDPLSLKVIRLKALASLASARTARPVEAIRTPVMIVHGQDDTIFPRDYVENVYRRLTCKKKFIVYEGVEHFLFTENVDLVLPDASAWIREVCEIPEPRPALH